MNDKREIWVDWLRVIACFMVMVVHSTEPFYLNDGSLVLTPGDAFWASFFDSLVRCCVPLFAVASSYLLFPLRYSTGEFLRRPQRTSRACLSTSIMPPATSGLYICCWECIC